MENNDSKEACKEFICKCESEYLDLIIQEKQIEERKAEIKALIMAKMIESRQTKIQTERLKVQRHPKDTRLYLSVSMVRDLHPDVWEECSNPRVIEPFLTISLKETDV